MSGEDVDDHQWLWVSERGFTSMFRTANFRRVPVAASGNPSFFALRSPAPVLRSARTADPAFQFRDIKGFKAETLSLRRSADDSQHESAFSSDSGSKAVPDIEMFFAAYVVGTTNTDYVSDSIVVTAGFAKS